MEGPANPALLSSCCVLLFPQSQSWLGATGRRCAAMLGALPLPSFAVISAFQCWGVGGLGHLFPSSLQALVSSALPSHCLSVPGQEGESACRTWPGSGQPAEGGQSCGSSWQGLPAEWEPRRSVSQSWAYHRHCSLCSQPL